MSAATVEPAYPRVAFQGELGAYGDAAIGAHWRGMAEPVPARTFEDALALLCSGRSDFAVIPVWNSSIGDLVVQQQALAAVVTRTRIVDELVVPVQHCLLGLPSASRDSVRIIGSHPAALAQCRAFFATRPRLVPRAAFDTAGAARELARLVRVEHRPHMSSASWFARAEAGPIELAVIASAAAAARYGLRVLHENIQDDPANATRFAVVLRR